ncbi:MAG: adenylate/guanylate cyclase domain-containing protein [Vicinamibacterales bacterium]
MYILVYGDPEHPTRHVLKAGDTIVGRAENCDLRISEPSLSRWHACFTVTADSCVLADVGSRNGTFVNGVQITKVELHHGDHLYWGDVSARVETSAEDQLTIVERATAPFPYQLDRPVDQTPPAEPTIDARRLLTLISEMSRSLAKNQPLANILDEVVRLASESTNAERAFLILKDETSGALVPRVARTREKGPTRQGAVSRTVLNRVMQERVAMLASNAQTDATAGAWQTIALHNIGSFMCAPLWSQENTIGALYLDTSITAEFQPADLELLVAFSNYAAVAIEQARLADRLHEETRRGERLGRYHSPAVVARILQDGSDADSPLLAQEREISVLFADIVGFTSMAEHMPPQQVATLLNACFARMTDVVFEHEGTLDKYIGDCLLAVFGAPLDQPDHAVRAVKTAQAIGRELEKLNQELSGPPMKLRMAINSGIALAGDIGSPRRREYTVLGDVVNTASRLESTVASPGQIVIGKATQDLLTPDIRTRSLGVFTLRGRKDEVEVFEVEP